jgi:hypothetical protein
MALNVAPDSSGNSLGFREDDNGDWRLGFGAEPHE